MVNPEKWDDGMADGWNVDTRRDTAAVLGRGEAFGRPFHCESRISPPNASPLRAPKREREQQRKWDAQCVNGWNVGSRGDAAGRRGGNGNRDARNDIAAGRGRGEASGRLFAVNPEYCLRMLRPYANANGNANAMPIRGRGTRRVKWKNQVNPAGVTR